MPDDPTAPVTADDLRDRMAKQMLAHHIDTSRRNVDNHNPCVCGTWWDDVESEGWDEHLAFVAWNAIAPDLAVRDEELERLRAETEADDKAISELNATTVRLEKRATHYKAEVERLADFGLKSRERHTAELERLRAELADERAETMRAASMAAQYAQKGIENGQRAEQAEADRDAWKTGVQRLRAELEDLRKERGAQLAYVENENRLRVEAEADRDSWIARTVKAEDRLDGQAWEDLIAERDALRARLTGVSVHALRLKTWIEDDKASITVAGSIVGDLLAAIHAPSPSALDTPGGPDSHEDAPTGGED